MVYIDINSIIHGIVYLWVLLVIGWLMGIFKPLTNYLKTFLGFIGEHFCTVCSLLITRLKNIKKNTRRNQEMPIERINAKSTGIANDKINPRTTNTHNGPDVDLSAYEADNHGIPLFDHNAPVKLRGIIQGDPNVHSTPPKPRDEMDQLETHVHRAMPLSLEPAQKEETVDPPKEFIDVSKKKEEGKPESLPSKDEDNTDNDELLELSRRIAKMGNRKLKAKHPVEEPMKEVKPSAEEPTAVALKIDDKPVYDLTSDKVPEEEVADEDPLDERQQKIHSMIDDFRYAYSEVGILSIFETLWSLDQAVGEKFIAIFLESTNQEDLAWIYNILEHSKKINMPDNRMRQAYRISKETGVDVDSVIAVLQQVNMF